MTAAPPPTWPSSRVLTGWWPHLDRLRPRSLWLYHLLLHRIEAPVAVAPPAAPERLARLLLDLLASTSGWPGADDWRFNVSVLRDCAEQSPEWKRRHGFPLEVLGFGMPTGEAWEQVVIDRPEQLLVLLVLSGSDAGEEKLLGFAVQP